MTHGNDKKLRTAWKLGGWEESKLDSSQRRAESLSESLGIGALLTTLMGGFWAVGMLILILAGPGSVRVFGAVPLIFFGLALAMQRASNAWALRAESLKKIGHQERARSILHRVERALVSSQKAREWKKDASWTGRELRMFDVEAMEVLAEREREANGAERPNQSQVAIE